MKLEKMISEKVMKLLSKEFYELMVQFEKDIKAMPVYILRIDREKNIGKNRYYENGEVNKLFISYMTGYESAKSLLRLGDLPSEE